MMYHWRFLINFTVSFANFGFWHAVLYLLHWARRPFQPGRQYRVSKVVHNMWYSLLGVAQFTVWEALYLHCCATQRIPFLSDQEAATSLANFANFCLAAFWVPIYRELHFYFSHR